MMARWVCLHGSIDASNRAEYLIEDREDYPDNTSVNFQTMLAMSCHVFACPALLMAKVQPSVVRSAQSHLRFITGPLCHRR